jgi:regulator of sigma E protease
MILKIFLGLMALSVVVFVHELGHFIVARLCGIEVEAFSLGWGKALVKKKIGATEYRISVLPLGGYCKMKGEHALVEALETKEKSIPQEDGSFYSASPLKRIAVAIAGPMANFIFAALVLTTIYLIGYKETTFDNTVILASDYDESGKLWPADLAGLESGDKILSINQKKIETYNQIAETMNVSAGKKLILNVERSGKNYKLELTPELNKDSGAGRAGIYPWINPVVGSVSTGSAAESSGLMKGDIIKGMNNIPVSNSLEISKILQEKPETLTLSIIRNGSTLSKEIKTDFDKTDFRLGITYEYLSYETPDLNVFQALGKGFNEAVNTVVLSARGLKLLFSGINLNKAVSGPIRITYFAGEIATNGFQQSVGAGFLSFFQFVSFISIALFFMNLLPIPALDGGQILLFIFEIVKKSPLSPISVYRYQMVGTFIILILVILTTTSDILFLAGK